MTIKQQGGIFGRNPTFNDVTVEGDLSVDGSLINNGDAVLVDADIGVTVQGYDADTAKLDVAQTFTATQRVDANVGIRTAPSILLGDGLHIKGTDYANLTLQKSASNWGHAVDFVDDTGALEFRLGTNFSSGGTNFLVAHTSGLAFKIDTSRNVTVTNGNLVIGTSGKGIDFSATSGTGTSELFDDYEEGTFTPALAGSSTAGSFTYTTQNGVYTKIGNIVIASSDVKVTSVATPAVGFVRLTGGPFTSNGNIISSSVTTATVSFSNSYVAANMRSSGSTEVIFYDVGTGGLTALDASLIVANSHIRVTAIYYTG